jgi:hypothetical protein
MREVTITRAELVETRCDGCGVLSTEVEGGLILVEIGVNVGEEFGRRDECEYCDACLVERGPALRAAGSRSELVGGTPPEEQEEPDEPDHRHGHLH